jgi:hypothetical protein
MTRSTSPPTTRSTANTLDRAKEIGAYVLDHHVTSVEIRRIHDTAQKRG